MTDKVKGFVVVLERDLRSDDAEQIKYAVLALKNVLTVQEITANLNDAITEARVRASILQHVFDWADKKFH